MYRKLETFFKLKKTLHPDEKFIPIFTLFLCFRNKDKLIKLGIFLK